MEDYKKEQWWIELQQSLDSFDDSKMSDSDLGRWNGAIIGGRIGGVSNVKSGHMKKIQKKGASLGGKAQGKIQGKKNVENKFWENLTFEQRSKGGKISHNNHIESGHWANYIKLGTEASTKARIERGLENKKKIIDSIKSDTFTTSEARKACKKFEYKSWKSLLKESKLVKQIYKGINQFDPSIYEKVKH
jgi:hypothetical protein